MRKENYFLVKEGILSLNLAELVPAMDSTGLPIGGPILGISFSMFWTALRNPRARSSTVSPLVDSACCESAAVATVPLREGVSAPKENIVDLS